MGNLGIALQDSDGASGYFRPPQVSEPDDVISLRVARLTAGQLDCLRLVNDHLSSKEIAAQLDISPHTVDQRIRGALHILGVERRSQAARIVARYGGEYQRLIHQSPHIERQPHSTATQKPRSAIKFGTLIAQGRPRESASGPSNRPSLSRLPCNCRSQRGETPGMR